MFSGIKFTAVGTSFVLVAFPLTQTVTQTRKRAESSGEDTGSDRSGKAGQKRDKRRQNGLTNSTTAAHNPEVVGSNPSPATTKKNSSPFGGLFFFIIVIENDPGQDFLPLLLSQNFFHYFHLYGIIYTKAEKAVARCREMLEP